MNKMREYERGREDGLDFALRIVRQGGIEALEKEVRFRNITGVHTSLAVKDLDKASEQIKAMTLDTFTILSIAVLHDYFGFGQIRCQRYMDGMDAEGWQRALMTAKAVTITLSGKRNIGDTGNDFVAGKTFTNGHDSEAYFEWIMPDGTSVSWPNAVIDVKNNSGGDATNVGALEFDVISNGKPTVTPAL